MNNSTPLKQIPAIQIELYEMLYDNFREQELIRLIHRMNLPYEELAGLPLGSKIRELMLLVGQREEWSTLISWGQEERPDLDWEVAQQLIPPSKMIETPLKKAIESFCISLWEGYLNEAQRQKLMQKLGVSLPKGDAKVLVETAEKHNQLPYLLTQIHQLCPELPADWFETWYIQQRASLHELLTTYLRYRELRAFGESVGIEFTHFFGKLGETSLFLLTHVEFHNRIPELVAWMKALRPHVQNIQRFEWQKPLQPLLPPHLLKFTLPVHKVRQPKKLVQLPSLLLQYFGTEELTETCFDVDIRFDDIPGVAWEDKLAELAVVLESMQEKGGGIQVKLFALAAYQHQPTINWPELMGFSAADLKGYKVQRKARDGTEYDTAVIRQLLHDIFQDNDTLLTFCENQEGLWQVLRKGMSIEMSFRQNVQTLLDAMWRRERFPDMLKALQEIAPEKYSAVFTPP